MEMVTAKTVHLTVVRACVLLARATATAVILESPFAPTRDAPVPMDNVVVPMTKTVPPTKTNLYAMTRMSVPLANAAIYNPRDLSA